MSAALHTQMRRYRHRRGQVALEYILVFLALLVATGVAVYFMRAPADVAVYTTEVICSDRM